MALQPTVSRSRQTLQRLLAEEERKLVALLKAKAEAKESKHPKPLFVAATRASGLAG